MPSIARRLAGAALLLAVPAAGLATELPVRAVTLSNAGLAQIERGGMLAPEAPAVLVVPLQDVDDVLKTLLLRDPTGTVAGVSLPARDLAEEAFRGLPLRPQDFESRTALLKALRGQRVEVAGTTGRLADVAEGAGDGLSVSLVTAAGLRLLRLREGDEIRLADAALAARVARAAEALAASRSADRREIAVRFEGADAPREVSLTTVTAAPLWKPSWRIVAPAEGKGAARLQGWAVVENRSGADWEGVRLSLVSGNPASFDHPLYTPIAVPRPDLPVRGAAAVRARPDTGARPPVPRAAPPQGLGLPTGPGGPNAFGLSMEPGPRDGVTPGGAAQVRRAAAAPSAGGRVAFTLPAPASIRSGETANLPFFDATLPAERLWWVQDLDARHPLQALRLINATPHVLPDGLATLYGADGTEAGAFLGEAEILAMAPDETRLLAFARDREVRLNHAEIKSERPVGARFRHGAVILDVDERMETALAVDPRGARGRIVVDIPYPLGFMPRFEVTAEGDFGVRHETMLEGAPTTLRFSWERETEDRIRLWDPGLGDPLILRWRDLDEDERDRLDEEPSFEQLLKALEALPADATGRPTLAAIVEGLEAARRLLDAARSAIRRYATADAALRRARAAVEDRTGPEREDARRALNAASLAAERAGAVADAAWEAWQRQVQQVLALTG